MTCRLCSAELGPEDETLCAACFAKADVVIRERLAEFTPEEAITCARNVALRAGNGELARALQSVLLLHLTGDLEAVAPALAAASVVVAKLREEGAGVN